MNSVNPDRVFSFDASADCGTKVRQLVRGHDPAVLSEIYQETTNIAIWQRNLSEPLMQTIDDYVASRQQPYISAIVTPSEAPSVIRKSLGSSSWLALGEDISELVDMFCCLFDLERAGLRLTVLRNAMCPKFHIDQVPCRMITTYQGAATQWLPHHVVDREKLGLGSAGKADAESGIYQDKSDIQTMACGDVALLKGETWQGNENAGLVHRSPALSDGDSRLLLTLDFSN